MKTVRLLEKNKKIKVVVGYLFCLMFFFSISSTMIGIIVSELSEDYQLSYSQIGLIGSVQSFGGLLVTGFGGIISDRFSKWRLIGLSFGCFSIILCMLGCMPPYILLLVYFLLLGIASNYLSLLISAYLPEIVEENVEFYMNMSHAFFGLGSLTGPLYSLFAMHFGMRWNRVFVALGIMCVLVMVGFFYISRTGLCERQERTETKETGSWKIVLADSRILKISITCFLYMGQQSVINLWIAPYLQEEMQSTISGIALSIYWSGVMVGRVVTSFLSKKKDSKKMLCTGCILSGILWLCVLPMRNVTALVWCLAVNGILTGAAFPIFLSTGCSYQPMQTGMATSVVCLAGSAGGSALTWLAGILVERFSYQSSLLMIPMILLICGALLVQKQGRIAGINK